MLEAAGERVAAQARVPVPAVSVVVVWTKRRPAAAGEEVGVAEVVGGEDAGAVGDAGGGVVVDAGGGVVVDGAGVEVHGIGEEAECCRLCMGTKLGRHQAAAVAGPGEPGPGRERSSGPPHTALIAEIGRAHV